MSTFLIYTTIVFLIGMMIGIVVTAICAGSSYARGYRDALDRWGIPDERGKK